MFISFKVTAIILSFVAIIRSDCNVRDNDLATAFNDAKVIPDYVSVALPCRVEVKYASGVEVDLGNNIFFLDVSLPPTTVSYDADPDSFYTLIMVGDNSITGVVDFPGKFLHWLVVNIPGDAVASGLDLAVYITPTPLTLITHPYRYVFLVYKQSGSISFGLDDFIGNSPALRLAFDFREFVNRLNLTGAVFGNFFIGRTLPKLL